MTYRTDLHKAHGIEVAGEAVYAAAASLTRNREQRAKWLELERLETETKKRVAAAIVAIGDAPKSGSLDRLLGRSVAAVLALLPWRLKMHMMLAIVRHAMKEWQRMVESNPDGDPELLQWLVAHERAQYDFAVDELHGRADRSLDQVREILGA